MIAVPQRRAASCHDDFVAAVMMTFQDLFGQYESEPVCDVIPDWASGHGIHSVSLPIEIAYQGGAAHGVASIVKHAIDMKASEIGRIARVERDGRWTVFFEAK